MSNTKQLHNLGRMVFDSSRPFSEPNGYYICGTPFCPECAEPRYPIDVEMNKEYGGRQCHENHTDLWLKEDPDFFDANGKRISRDEVFAIGGDGETDTPAHCIVCGALLVERLTTDGQEYVRDFCRRKRNLVAKQYREVFAYVFGR